MKHETCLPVGKVRNLNFALLSRYDFLVDILSVNNAEYQNRITVYFEDYSVISNSEFPVSLQGLS